MVQFTDERDAGPLLMSHFSLLLGMSVPLWLALGRVEASVLAEINDGVTPPPFQFPRCMHLLAIMRCVFMSAITFVHQGREELLCGPGPAAGMLALGFLDTAASVVGTTAGRLPIYTGAKKTLEGLVGGGQATLCALPGICRLWWLL